MSSKRKYARNKFGEYEITGMKRDERARWILNATGAADRLSPDDEAFALKLLARIGVSGEVFTDYNYRTHRREFVVNGVFYSYQQCISAKPQRVEEEDDLGRVL